MKRRKQSNADMEAQNILNALRQIVQCLRQASTSSERKIGLTSAQLFVLQKIAENEEPLSINGLASKTLTHQSSVSVVVAKLVEKNLVVRSPSKQDARSLKVKISKKGKSLLSRAPPLIQDQLMRGLLRLSSSKRSGLMDGLNTWIAAAGIKGAEPSLFFEDRKGD